jgi:hypothetical protein
MRTVLFFSPDIVYLLVQVQYTKCVIYHTGGGTIPVDLLPSMSDRYTKELKQFGKRIKELRTGLGMTQVDLEVKTDIERA